MIPAGETLQENGRLTGQGCDCEKRHFLDGH